MNSSRYSSGIWWRRSNECLEEFLEEGIHPFANRSIILLKCTYIILMIYATAALAYIPAVILHCTRHCIPTVLVLLARRAKRLNQFLSGNPFLTVSKLSSLKAIWMRTIRGDAASCHASSSPPIGAKTSFVLLVDQVAG